MNKIEIFNLTEIAEQYIDESKDEHDNACDLAKCKGFRKMQLGLVITSFIQDFQDS